MKLLQNCKLQMKSETEMENLPENYAEARLILSNFIQFRMEGVNNKNENRCLI